MDSRARATSAHTGPSTCQALRNFGADQPQKCPADGGVAGGLCTPNSTYAAAQALEGGCTIECDRVYQANLGPAFAKNLSSPATLAPRPGAGDPSTVRRARGAGATLPRAYHIPNPS